jgi:hypothetical protein
MTPSQLVACWIMLDERTTVSRDWLSNTTLCRKIKRESAKQFKNEKQHRRTSVIQAKTEKD